MANPLLKQSLSQKLLQKLSPQQIQLMKLLQIPTATLDQRIKEELEANPALEESEDQEEVIDVGEEVEDNYGGGDAKESEEAEPEPDLMKEEEFELDDYLTEYIEDDPSSYKLRSDNYSIEEEDKSIPIAVESSFHEYLERQLGLLDLKDERTFTIASQIIGSIDDDGYLRREPIAIIDDLMFSQNITTTEEEINELLSKIQRFDPPGTGARNLQECLKLQLEHRYNREELNGEEKRTVLNAIKIIGQYFDQFSKKHYIKLKRQLGVNDEDLKYAIDEILRLNPKPASGHDGGGNRKNIHYIVPDFIIVNRDGELDLTLNSRNAPDLRINDQYKDMLKSYKVNQKGKRANRQEKEAVMFIKQKIDSAKWFIDAIRQRQQTMYRTMYAILQYQYDFFLSGDQKTLRPMILKDIAEITGLDISTVSRVANSKFVQTEFGTKRLKDFFSESLMTKNGEEVSTLEVKKILTDIISNENKRKPLSDEKLKNMLRDKGYNIARRTVAKYREQLNIPVARLRKEL
jgi:RNA polymerase sigma-54 factor